MTPNLWESTSSLCNRGVLPLEQPSVMGKLTDHTLEVDLRQTQYILRIGLIRFAHSEPQEIGLTGAEIHAGVGKF